MAGTIIASHGILVWMDASEVAVSGSEGSASFMQATQAVPDVHPPHEPQLILEITLAVVIVCFAFVRVARRGINILPGKLSLHPP
jgi:hypothetical protein